MWNRKGQPEELVARPQAKQVVFPYMIARLHRVFFCSLNSLDSEAIGVLTSSIGYVRFGAGMLVPLQGAAAGCCSGCCCWGGVRFGAGLLVPLQSAASGCCAAALLLLGAPAERCQSCGCRAAVRAMCTLWSWRAGATAECCFCRPVQGAGAGYYCQRAVCILGIWVLLQGTAVRGRCALWSFGAGVAARGGCEMAMAVWALGPDGDYVDAVA